MIEWGGFERLMGFSKHQCSAKALEVHTVTDPGLPDAPLPSPAKTLYPPQQWKRPAEWTNPLRNTRMAFVSATVFDRSRTLLNCYPQRRNREGDSNRFRRMERQRRDSRIGLLDKSARSQS